MHTSQPESQVLRSMHEICLQKFVNIQNLQGHCCYTHTGNSTKCPPLPLDVTRPRTSGHFFYSTYFFSLQFLMELYSSYIERQLNNNTFNNLKCDSLRMLQRFTWQRAHTMQGYTNLNCISLISIFHIFLGNMTPMSPALITHLDRTDLHKCFCISI